MNSKDSNELAHNELVSNEFLQEQLDKAKQVLEQREEQYGSYANHVELFAQINEQLDFQLFQCLKRIRDVSPKDHNLITHVSYSLSLKFARILCNPSYEDSYTDVFGYLLLFMRTAKLQAIKLKELDFISKDHEANKLIRFINEQFGGN